MTMKCSAVTSVRVSVIVAALACAVAPAEAGRRAGCNQCVQTPGPHLRLRLAPAPEGIALDTQAIENVVQRVWSAECLEIEWVPSTAPWTPDNLDVSIQVQRGPLDGAETSRASVVVVQGQPRRLVQVSLDATIARAERSLIRSLQLQPASARHLILGGGLMILERSIGYAIAHEIGHLALGLPGHPAAGLMSTSYDSVAIVPASNPGSLQLDWENRRRLHQRFAITAECLGR